LFKQRIVIASRNQVDQIKNVFRSRIPGHPSNKCFKLSARSNAMITRK
jgi:hypothetical protein